MSAKLNIFITGATGYIGGCVVSRLLKHPKAFSFEITALVRSAEKAEKLHGLGIKTVLGSYTDKRLDFLTDAASKADVVFAIADCDNLPAAQAILDGLKVHHEQTGRVPILIHTSGTAIITDDARGQHANHRTYSDLESEVLNALPVTVIHRNVDIPIVEADKAGYVKAYIITPGTVFGYPSGPLVDLKIQNTHSQQLPYIIKPAIARKQGAYIGKGLNTWSAVDVEDTADLFIIIFNAATSNSTTAGHGTEGYYFVENFEYTGLEVAQVTSETLVELGISGIREPSAFAQEELDKNYGPFWPLLSNNSYAKGDRGRALGWVPKRSTKELFLANVKQEVAHYARELKVIPEITPVVEIVTFSASEAFLANTSIAEEVLLQFKKADGILSVDYGFEVEDKTKAYILITRKSTSKESQQNDYLSLSSLVNGAISIQHIDFSCDTTAAFTAPVTQIATIKGKEGYTQADVSKGIAQIREHQHLAKGGHPPIGWGLIKETPELSILTIGWDSVEAHAASYTVAPFDKITGGLQRVADPSPRHVVLKRV